MKIIVYDIKASEKEPLIRANNIKHLFRSVNLALLAGIVLNPIFNLLIDSLLMKISLGLLFET